MILFLKRSIKLPVLDGEGEVLYRVPVLPLLDGLYHVSVAIVNWEDTDTYDFRDRQYSFRVENNQAENVERYGLITLQGKWLVLGGEQKGMKKQLSIVVYTNVEWEHALAWLRYRAVFAALGWNVLRGNDADGVYPEKVSQADIVLIQRGFPQNFEAFDQVLAIARERGKPIVYEIDDWLPEIPEDHPAYAAHLEQWLTVFLGVFEADVVLVSSRNLQENLLPFHPRVLLLPNGLPDELWKVRTPQPPEQKDIVVMGYMGTATHLRDLFSSSRSPKRAVQGIFYRSYRISKDCQ